MKVAARDWKALRRLQDEQDRCERERDIARCECGGQVRRDSCGLWHHVGPCCIGGRQ